MARFHHHVLFRLREGAVVDEAMAWIESSRPSEGLLEWRVARSLDERKGPVIVEHAVFVDRAAYDAFVTSPAHRRAGELMSKVADWLVGDFDEPDAGAAQPSVLATENR